MKIKTPCTKCKNVHTTSTRFRVGEAYTTEPALCFGCAEKKARKDRTAQWAKEGN